MTKSERLLALLQLLRQYRQAVKAETLAEALEVSSRTIYRDIETLRHQGADIAGEAGIGYVLRDGFLLPPLMFSIDEIEALLLGSRWVKSHADASLNQAAKQAMAKIEAVIPRQHQAVINHNTLFTPLMSDRCNSEQMAFNASTVRQAMREEKKLRIDYQDGQENLSQRIIHPFALAFFDSVQVVGAWCQLRQAFRNFRVDRIIAVTLLTERYYPNRATLYDQWKRDSGISPSED